MGDHRASSAYRSVMLSGALIKLYTENLVIAEATS